ncbi:MAG: DUF2330 domain-containing protein [Labilithrix sp.]|nr:DUF2330 domain-containing protein [Labilithrix sp.]
MLAVIAAEGHAEACGGCFNPPENPTVVTDHRMILSISKDQSTLYDQIRYQGSPASFAWVLPISGEITVGLSADIVFSGLDQITQTQLNPPPLNCPAPPANCRGSSSGFGGATGAEDDGSNGVTVIKKEVVGPYETVQLQATNPTALDDWLAQNGFNVPADVKPVVAKYQQENFNFLALKLVPGKGVQDMRPVRVSTKGANVALPLRMVAAGTGPNVGIALWVVGEGRYEPQNFASFTIPTADIVWDWNQRKSNYTELRAQKTAAGSGRTWEIESSTIVYRQQIESIVNQGSYDGSGPFPQTDEERAARDYLPVTDDQGATTKTAVQVRDEDMGTLFYGIATATSRVTRLRADLVHAALDADLVMRASPDQSVLSNVRQLTSAVGTPQCPSFSGCGDDGDGSSGDVTVGSGGGDGTFTCATGPRTGNAWIGLGLGFAAVAAAHAIRRRRDPR